MSRAKEIQEKLLLQAQLQTSFNNTSLKVKEWMDSGTTIDDKSDLALSKTSFYQLPVIGMGLGLNFDEDSNGNKEDISTIGEFIDSNKKVSSLAKKRRRNIMQPQEKSSIYTVSANDTRAMVALKRKIRKDHKEKNINKESKDLHTTSTVRSEQKKETNIEDEDSDDDSRVEKTVPKSFGLLFDGKKRKKFNK